jgi:hypothetical protein
LGGARLFHSGAVGLFLLQRAAELPSGDDTPNEDKGDVFGLALPVGGLRNRNLPPLSIFYTRAWQSWIHVSAARRFSAPLIPDVF